MHSAHGTKTHIARIITLVAAVLCIYAASLSTATAQTDPNDPYNLYGGIFEDTSVGAPAQTALPNDPYNLYGGIFDDTPASNIDFSTRDLDSGDFSGIEVPATSGTGSLIGDIIPPVGSVVPSGSLLEKTLNASAGGTLLGGLGDKVGGIFKDLGIGGAGVGELGAVLGGGIGGALPPGVGDIIGGITGLGGGGGSFVPVKDFVQIALQEKLVGKEYNLDPVASLAAKTTLRGILGNVLNFINSGDNGNPYYVTNSIGHFQNVEKGVTNKFLVELRGLGIDRNIIRAIALSEQGNFRSDIRPTISPGELQSFLSGQSRGWSTWRKVIEPKNNAYGQYMLSSQELERRQQEAELRESQELAWGRGYKSAKVCLVKDIAGQCLYSEIVTPGSFIENQQAAVFTSIIRQLESDDELQEITSSLLSGMISQIMGGRQTGLRGFSVQSIRPIASPVADAAAIDRTKSGLRDSIRTLFQDETEYLSKKSSSLVRLNQSKESLETLLPARVYSFTEPLQSRVKGSAELAATVESNRGYATTTINQIIVPAQLLVAQDIIASTRLLEEIRLLDAKLVNAVTPDDLVRISNEYLALSKRTHGKADIGKLDDELRILGDFVTSVMAEVSSRFAQENAIIDKIRSELPGSTPAGS